jgi:citrate lyase subunit beta/citryl-CoA lyase
LNTTAKPIQNPRDVLQGAQAGAVVLPVCDHYSGVEARMRKSLQLQAEMQQEFGVCVFDVTLDCEDGAPVGGEAEHAALRQTRSQRASPR